MKTETRLIHCFPSPAGGLARSLCLRHACLSVFPTSHTALPGRSSLGEVQPFLSPPSSSIPSCRSFRKSKGSSHCVCVCVVLSSQEARSLAGVRKANMSIIHCGAGKTVRLAGGRERSEFPAGCCARRASRFPGSLAVCALECLLLGDFTTDACNL